MKRYNPNELNVHVSRTCRLCFFLFYLFEGIRRMCVCIDVCRCEDVCSMYYDICVVYASLRPQISDEK